MADALPSGTVTFLFTDIEGSTQLLHRLGETYAQVLGEHHQLLRQTWAEHSGVEVDTAGDGFFVAFPTAPAGVAAASWAHTRPGTKSALRMPRCENTTGGQKHPYGTVLSDVCALRPFLICVGFLPCYPGK
jgi:class 3 adenylate cyclase